MSTEIMASFAGSGFTTVILKKVIILEDPGASTVTVISANPAEEAA
jgi:hypothetical protein